MAGAATMKTVLITGGNAGLGLACARTLVAPGGPWHVAIACRSAERAAEAIATLPPGAPVTPLPLDLASLASVRALPAALEAAQLPPLGALVCNAGMQVVTGLSTTADGFETTFGVNHLGHLLLAELLVSQLSPDGRIVFVASGTHDPAQRTGMPAPSAVDARALAYPPPDEEGPLLAGLRRYSTSKLCNVLAAYELQRRLRRAGSAIDVFAYDPGLMPGTGLARDNGAFTRFFWHRILPLFRRFVPMMQDPDTSGAALARLATDPALAGTGGRYFERERAIASSTTSYDEALAARLYDDSLALLR